MKINNRAMTIALNRSLSCGIKMIRDASLIKAVENLRSATYNQRAYVLDHDRHTNGREWGVFDYMFDMFEQVGGAQSTLEG